MNPSAKPASLLAPMADKGQIMVWYCLDNVMIRPLSNLFEW